MAPNAKKLRDLMEHHQVNTKQVADMLGRTPTTVRIWRCKSADRQIPEQALRLLELLLDARARSAGGK